VSTQNLTKDLRAALRFRFPKHAPEHYALGFVARTFLLHIVILFLISYTCQLASPILLVPIWVSSALIIYRYQFVLHEASHYVLCKSRAMNDFIGRIAGAAVGYNFEEYRYNHRIHHGYVGTDLDTEIDNFIRENNLFGTSRIQMIRKLLSSLIGLDALRIVFRTGRSNSKLDRNNQYIFLLFISAVIQLSCLWLFTSGVTLILAISVYSTSVICGTFFVNRLRAISEHEVDQVLAKFEFSKSHTNSPLVALIAPLNFNFHYEHHVFPDISSYYYPDVNKLIKETIGNDTWCRTSFTSTLVSYWRSK